MNWEDLPAPAEHVSYNVHHSSEVTYKEYGPLRTACLTALADASHPAIPEIDHCFGYYRDEAIAWRWLPDDRTLTLELSTPEYLTATLVEKLTEILRSTAPQWRIVINPPWFLAIPDSPDYDPFRHVIAVYPAGVKIDARRERLTAEQAVGEWQRTFLKASDNFHKIYRQEFKACDQRLRESGKSATIETPLILGVFESFLWGEVVQRVWYVHRPLNTKDGPWLHGVIGGGMSISRSGLCRVEEYGFEVDDDLKTRRAWDEFGSHYAAHPGSVSVHQFRAVPEPTLVFRSPIHGLPSDRVKLPLNHPPLIRVPIPADQIKRHR